MSEQTIYQKLMAFFKREPTAAEIEDAIANPEKYEDASATSAAEYVDDSHKLSAVHHIDDSMK